MRENRTVVLNVVSFLFILFFFANTVNAAGGGGLSVYPYKAEGEDGSRSWFVYTDIKPGAIINDKAVVKNLSDHDSVSVLIYAVDAATTGDGGYAPASDDALRTDVGLWTTTAQSKLELGPGESKIVPITINIPRKVVPGDHFGTILVRSDGSGTIIKKGDVIKGGGNGSIHVITRVGSRIYVTIAGELIKKLSFDKFVFELKDGKPYFNVSITNDGNTRLTPNGVIEIYDESGLKLVGSLPLSLREIFPFTSTTVPFEWTNRQYGQFIAKALVHGPNGEEYKKEISFELFSPTEKIAPPSSGYSSSTILVVFLLLVIIFLVKKVYFKSR